MSNAKLAHIIKKVEAASTKISAYELLADVFEAGAIAVSNRFDTSKAAKLREEKYQQIMKKHSLETQKQICDIFAEILVLLTNQTKDGFYDYLGELYMASNTGNKKAGQFFTPYHVSELNAAAAMNDKIIKLCKSEDEILSISEPSCGSGGMVLAAADILLNEYDFNIARNLYVECSDIDRRCVHMAYLQIGLAGIPAVVYWQNTLTRERWERWETPAYILQWPRFKEIQPRHYKTNDEVEKGEG